jgi:predicted N-acetyltransferase YhbS
MLAAPAQEGQAGARTPMFRLLAETPRDRDEVEMLLDTAFAPGRTALSSYRLRDGVRPVADLCRVARDEFDAVAGCIRFWPVRVGPAGHDALLLGPVAVHPTRQGEGIGALLIADALERARDSGWARVILVGDEPYYRRFGFTRETAKDLRFPPPTNPERLLARPLAPGAFEGVSGMVRKWTD